MCCLKTLKEDHSNAFKTLMIIGKLLIFGIPIYLLQTDIKETIEYHQRDNYKYVTLNRTTETYYIIKQNANIENCSSDSYFSSNISSVYDTIIARSQQNIFFIGILWFNIVIVSFLMLFKLYSLLREIFLKKSDKNNDEPPFICILIPDKILKESWAHATLSTATYFATIFDYSDICLKSLSDAEMFGLLHYGYSILLPIVATLWIFISLGCTKYTYRRCYSECSILDMNPIIKKQSGLGNKVVKYGIWIGFFFSIQVHLVGVLLWVLMIMNTGNRVQAILILISAVFTIFIETLFDD